MTQEELIQKALEQVDRAAKLPINHSEGPYQQTIEAILQIADSYLDIARLLKSYQAKDQPKVA